MEALEPDTGTIIAERHDDPRRQSIPATGRAAAGLGYGLILIHFVPFILGLVPWSDLMHPSRATQSAWHVMGALVQGESDVEIWRVWTALFLHGGIVHLLLNVVALRALGSELESVVGSTRFLVVFFLAGWVGNLVSLLVGSPGLSVGASGAIYGVGSAWVVVGWFRSDGLRPAVLGLLLVVSLAIGVVLDLRSDLRIDHGAHVGGLLTGAVVGAYLARPRRGTTRWLTVWAVLASSTLVLPPFLAARSVLVPAFSEVVPTSIPSLGLTLDVPGAWHEESISPDETIWTERGLLRLHLKIIGEPGSREITPEALVESKLGFLQGEVNTPLRPIFQETRLGALGGVLVGYRAEEEVWWLRCFDRKRSIALFHLRSRSSDDEIEGARLVLRSLRE